jgi:hypothetical protein
MESQSTAMRVFLIAVGWKILEIAVSFSESISFMLKEVVFAHTQSSCILLMYLHTFEVQMQSAKICLILLFCFDKNPLIAPVMTPHKNSLVVRTLLSQQ